MEIVVNGKKYKLVEGEELCLGCAFYTPRACEIQDEEYVCHPPEDYGLNWIFVEA